MYEYQIKVSISPESNWNFVRKPINKILVCALTTADVMIDDSLRNCINIKKNGVKHVFWFCNNITSFEYLDHGIINVKNWHELCEKIDNIYI